MTFIRTMIQRPALVSVIYLIILIFGLFSYTRLPIDMLPDMEAPVVTVVTAYPGLLLWILKIRFHSHRRIIGVIVKSKRDFINQS